MSHVSCQWVSTHTTLVIEQVCIVLPVHDLARDPEIRCAMCATDIIRGRYGFDRGGSSSGRASEGSAPSSTAVI